MKNKIIGLLLLTPLLALTIWAVCVDAFARGIVGAMVISLMTTYGFMILIEGNK